MSALYQAKEEAIRKGLLTVETAGGKVGIERFCDDENEEPGWTFDPVRPALRCDNDGPFVSVFPLS